MSRKTPAGPQTEAASKSPSASSTKPKSKAGRPTDYREEYCEFIVAEGRKGNSFEEIASKLDVHTDTLREWKSKHPKFSAAFKRAKQEQINYFMRLGRAGLIGQKTDENGRVVIPNFNVPVWIFWMKARFGWRDDGSSAIDVDDQNEMEFVFGDVKDGG